jgi:hypothetical protein
MSELAVVTTLGGCVYVETVPASNELCLVITDGIGNPMMKTFLNPSQGLVLLSELAAAIVKLTSVHKHLDGKQ